VPYASVLYVNSIDKYFMDSFLLQYFSFSFVCINQKQIFTTWPKKWYSLLCITVASSRIPMKKFHLSPLYDNWTCAYLNTTPLIDWANNFLIIKKVYMVQLYMKVFNFNHHIFNCYGNSQWGIYDYWVDSIRIDLYDYFCKISNYHLNF